MVPVNPPSNGAGGSPATTLQQQSLSGAPPPTEAPSQLGVAALAGLSEDALKKIRKPYTISKSRESWTEQEHDKFLEALQLFDRDWKKIEAFVGSKTVIQIRSHAQKYFLKVQKNGTSEHVPPPRPKRKAAHPYPQKASKNAGATMSSWAHCSFPPVSALHVAKDIGTAILSCSSSVESPRGPWPACEAIDPGNHVPSLRVMPDFTQVYTFLGNVFDPSTSGHLQKLKEMDPIDVETVLLLMRNLSVNLNSPDFEDHRRTLSAYDTEVIEVKPGSKSNVLLASQAMNTPFA